MYEILSAMCNGVVPCGNCVLSYSYWFSMSIVISVTRSGFPGTNASL